MCVHVNHLVSNVVHVAQSHLISFLLYLMSYAAGLHHSVGVRDETKHDFVWPPVSGTAMIHANPAVSGGELQ